MLERNPALKPDEVRAILTKTARDLGAPGRDDLFGAGAADGFAAVSAAADAPSVPIAVAPDAPAAARVSDRQQVPASRALASGKSAPNDAIRPAADFAATFGLGTNGQSLVITDVNGVALVAIQGLYAELQERRKTA